jgi:hypothetical protein
MKCLLPVLLLAFAAPTAARHAPWPSSVAHGGNSEVAPTVPPPTRGAIVLVASGRPAMTIVIPQPEPPFARRAAGILQSSVQKMSGVVLGIVARKKPGGKNEISIGFAPRTLPGALRSRAATLVDDGYLVAASGRTIRIVSGGHKGAIYGVVHLLERYFGCRRFSPTVAVFPRRDTLAVGTFTDVEKPVNQFRVVNGDFSRDADYTDWLRLDTTDDMFPRGYYVHTFNRLVPWETYFADHPEYFALMNGKRIRDQICPTHPEVLALAIAKLKAEMAAQPEKKVWSVSQNDNSSYCQCPACRKVIEEEGSPAGPIIRFVNAVAARFPDKIISTLAYQYSRPAPKVTRPAKNVQIMLCTIELNRSLAIADDPTSRSFVQDIRDWSGLTRNLYLWDYTVNFSHHVSPFPNLRVLQPNIQFFTRNGVRQHFQQTNTGAGHEFSELKSYLLARLLWNPDCDAAAVMKEFLDGYYGAAGPWIGQYISQLEAGLAARGETRLDIYEPPAAHVDDYLSAANVATYNECFDRAEAAVRSDAEILARVKTARLPLQYAMLEIGKNDLFGPRGFYAERDGRFEPRPEMRLLLEDFHATAVRSLVRNLSESGLTPDDYYQSALRFTDVQVEGNLAFRKPVAADPPPSPKYGRGNLQMLTDGVRGAHDFRVHWLGWEGLDFNLTLDVGPGTNAGRASLSTLYDQRSWILHPRRVTCYVSTDGEHFQEIQTLTVDGDQRTEDVVRLFEFTWSIPSVRYIRFHVEGTKQLPAWHPSAGGASWVFVDEIVVR